VRRDYAPPPLKLLGAGEWTLGQPDLVVSTPKVYVSAVASDWSGSLEKSPIGLTIDRYARSAEFIETRDIKMGNATMNLNNRFVFHHMTTQVTGPEEVTEEGEDPGEDANTTSLPIHEVGRNGDVFPDDAGKLLPGGGFIGWAAHIHASGLPGSDSYSRLHIGFRLHPEGYVPKRQIRGIGFGRSQLQVDGGTGNNRDDAYKVLPQAVKIWNYEPHMHANGIRMCLQAIYGRAVETLNCAGYDHNWVRN
jgi:hypothetical protein